MALAVFLLHHTTAKVPYVPAEPHTDMQFAPNRLKYLHEAGGGELGVEVECDFSANSREARGKHRPKEVAVSTIQQPTVLFHHR